MKQRDIRKYVVKMTHIDDGEKLNEMSNNLLDCIDGEMTVKELFYKLDFEEK